MINPLINKSKVQLQLKKLKEIKLHKLNFSNALLWLVVTFFVVPFKVYGVFWYLYLLLPLALILLWFKQLNSPKQYLISRVRLSSSQFPLNKHQLKFIHQQYRGQEKKARNNLILKTAPLQLDLMIWHNWKEFRMKLDKKIK